MAKKVKKVTKKKVSKKESKKLKPTPKGKNKVKVVMDEWKSGKLHSGSKKGPVVTNQKQAIAIALSEQRKANKGKRKKKSK